MSSQPPPERTSDYSPHATSAARPSPPPLPPLLPITSLEEETDGGRFSKSPQPREPPVQAGAQSTAPPPHAPSTGSFERPPSPSPSRPVRRSSRRNITDDASASTSQSRAKGKEREKTLDAFPNPADDGSDWPQPTRAPENSADTPPPPPPPPPAYALTEHDRCMVEEFQIVPPSSRSRAGLTRDEHYRAFHNDSIIAGHLHELGARLDSLAQSGDGRYHELLNLIQDTSAARGSGSSSSTFNAVLTSNEHFRRLYDAVAVYSRDLDAVSRAINDLRRDIASLRTSSLATTMPAQPSSSTQFGAGTWPPLPAPAPLHPRLASMAPPTMTAPPVIHTPNRRRPASTPMRRARGMSTPQAKRPRVELDYRSSDVVVWPVGTGTAPLEIAYRLMHKVTGFHESNVATCIHYKGRPDVISIRFQNRLIAERFVAAFAASPPAGMDHMTAMLSDDPSLPVVLDTGDEDLAVITGGHHQNPRGLRLCAWNIHGNLALKIVQTDVVSFMNEHDIVVFQETWLGPTFDEALQLPPGFLLFAAPRPQASNLQPQRGGLVAVIKSSVAAHVLQQFCAPDCLVLLLHEFVLITVYLPPITSRWEEWTDVSPEDRLFSTIPAVSQLTQKPVVVIGDLNARTASSQSLPYRRTFPRVSSDVASNARGMRILDMCAADSLLVLNGTSFEGPGAGLFTSFQPLGSSVIDYVIVSDSMLRFLEPSCLRVVQSDWSDHACLSLHLHNCTPMAQQPLPAQSLSSLKSNLANLLKATPSDSVTCTLNGLLHAALENALTDEEASLRLYGPATNNDTPLSIYTASTCRRPHRGAPLAAFGVFYGDKNTSNVGRRVAGTQTDARAAVAAILYVLHNTSPYVPIYLYSTSQTAIRTIVFWASKNASQGWKCPNGDLFTSIVAFITNRSASVSFRWVPALADNGHFRSAKLLANAACLRGVEAIFYSTPNPPSLVRHDTHSHPSLPKVTTTLPQLPPPPHASIVHVSPEHIDFNNEAHRGRAKERAAKLQNLLNLMTHRANRDFWNLIRKWSDPKPRAPLVTAQQLFRVFRARINPPSHVPPTFNTRAHAAAVHLVNTIPPITVDRTAGQYFSRPFTMEELQWAKTKITKGSAKSACGADGVSYTTIARIPNEDLLRLLQACIDTGRVPGPWLHTVLVGVLKVGKDGKDPENYRLIGLESCMLKLLTLIIDKRLREWSEAEHILPDTQNAFRPQYRTNNNSFILRCVIERAHARGHTLFMVFIDLKNAFPSTDLATLWAKLYRKGVAGPLFDWLRNLYHDMAYVVQQGGVLSETFKSLIGLLTGDTASPALWNIFFSDLAIPDHPDDVILDDNGRPISHIEQADDVVLFSTTAAGLQFKIDKFVEWCAMNQMVISVPKSNWAVSRPLHEPLPTIHISGSPLQQINAYKYVGITFDFAQRHLFRAHCSKKASAARSVAGAIFALDSFVGVLPPVDARRLYMARVDPHLIFGCEVIIDTDSVALNEFEKVQLAFIRRMLGLSARSLIHPLFTETGIMPIKYRRIVLALGYLSYLFHLPPHHLAAVALRDSLNLAWEGKPSWIADLVTACHTLPHPVLVDLRNIHVSAGDLALAVTNSANEWLRTLWRNSNKLVFFLGSHDISKKSVKPYLRIHNPRHRLAITKLLLSDHLLAVEQLRRSGRGRPLVERHHRLCRFCTAAVEDEGHALFGCRSHPQLLQLRAQFLQNLFALEPPLRIAFQCVHTTLFVESIVQDNRLCPMFAAYVYDVFTIYDTAEIFNPNSRT
ncbi:RNA-directed DNA polymerase from mobile element jockey [Hypsizygus marmoreus]|uniref:RNA-directed DNA polymerase from mobile element jockey n=1 Tax=Hypsizygus marmoreus TaxID=39966 RepID=A0A369JU85_HYPMA|nr:RNA-directed DNA polymerase from mobile element jockey [Hypsizygus marmoreus]